MRVSYLRKVDEHEATLFASCAIESGEVIGEPYLRFSNPKVTVKVAKSGRDIVGVIVYVLRRERFDLLCIFGEPEALLADLVRKLTAKRSCIRIGVDEWDVGDQVVLRGLGFRCESQVGRHGEQVYEMVCRRGAAQFCLPAGG